MEIPYQKIFQFLYGPFFAVLDFFIRNYRTNRERLTRLTSDKRVSSLLQYAAIALLFIWILIFLFASEESRNSLSEEVKQSFEEMSPPKQK